MDHEGDEWMIRSRVFCREDEPVSDDYEDGDDDDLLATPQAPDNFDRKVKKTPLDKHLDKLASLKTHPPPRAVSAQEFETKYGLPSKGKNPHKLRPPHDLHDKEVTDVFGPPKGRKGRSGYHYGECKDEEILERIAEIFPIVYLRDLPKSKIIAKQFARGIIVEKHKKKPVSWAEFAGTSNKNQRSKWMKNVKLCLSGLAELTGADQEDLYKLEGLDDLFHDPTAGSSPGFLRTSNATVNEEVTEVVPNGPEREKDIRDIMELMKLVGVQLHATNEDYVTAGTERAELASRVAQEEGVLRRTEAKVAKLLKVSDNHDAVDDVEVASKKQEAYHEMVKDAMVDFEAASLELKGCSLRYGDLQTRQTCLRRQLDALSFQLAHMKRGEVGISLRPRPLCSLFDSQMQSKSDPIPVKPCVICLNQFPLNDIIVCTCGHLYHPWCAGLWFRVASTCADATCGATVHPNWFRSFGFGQLHGPLQKLVQSLELEKEQEMLLETLKSTVLESHPNIDPDTVYQEQLQQSTVSTWTQSVGGTEAITLTESIGIQSLGNNSATGTEQRGGESPKRPLVVLSQPSLACIDEVDSPEKTEPLPCLEPLATVDGDGGNYTSLIRAQLVADDTNNLIIDVIGGGACKTGVETELEERIKKLREEAAEFERLRKLRQEAADLERLKKLREEAAELELQKELRNDGQSSELDDNKSRSQGVTRAVIKVPHPPPLPPIDKEKETAVSKRKTRSEIAAEEAAKEAAAKEAAESTKKRRRRNK